MSILSRSIAIRGLAVLAVTAGLAAAAARLRTQGVDVSDESVAAAQEFVEGRFHQQLRDEGISAGLVDAVAPLADAPGKAELALKDIEAVFYDCTAGAALHVGHEADAACVVLVGRVV